MIDFRIADPLANSRFADRFQKLCALIGNPRSSQQLMGQLANFFGLKAKFNDFSCVGAYALGLSANAAPSHI
jgi:hypothetical protein